MMASLLVLAKETSGDKRRELLRSMADLFIDREQDYSDRELVLFGEVIGDLLDQVDLDGRVELSRKIADCDRQTGDLHLRLAEDRIEVAEPVLRDCSLFDEDTLAEIAGRQSQDHLYAISRRGSLGTKVTDVLVDRGEKRVVRAVTNNLGAEISDESFNKILDKAADDPELQSAVSYRADMPLEIAERALKVLPPEKRDRLVALMAEEPDTVTALVGKADASTRQLRLAQSRRRLQTKGLIVQIRENEIDLDSVLVLLAREDRYQNMALILAEFARMKESVVLNALFKVDDGAIVLLLKALGVTEPAVKAIAQSRGRRLNLPASMTDRLVAAWREADALTADKVMTLSRLRARG